MRTRPIRPRSWRLWLRRAFVEFLGIPVAVLAAFMLLAAAMYFADDAWSKAGAKHSALLGWLDKLFGDQGSTSSLLGTIASGLITVTSITFSLLLLAVQQGAAAFSSQVFDQFLRRRANQFYFGFFVGLSVYALVILVMTNGLHHPVFGALVAVLLTAAALCMVVVLIYTTIDQMRSTVVVRAIHDHTLIARELQLELLAQTRRECRDGLDADHPVEADRDGVVSKLDVGAIARAITRAEAGQAGGAKLEIDVQAAVGSAVAYRDVLAHIRSDRPISNENAALLAQAVRDAIELGDERSLDRDPGLGVSQLATIGWTSTSTARSNPQPALAVCRSLRDLLARWSEEEPREDPASPVVYPDRVPGAAVAALESMAVAASESLQHQTLAEILRTQAALLPRLPPPLQARMEDTVLRSLSALGEHVLTGELDAALRTLADALASTGLVSTATAVRKAADAHRESIARLNSRSTRVPSGGPG